MEHFTKKINLSLILVFVIFLLFTSIFRNSILFSEYTEYIDILDQSVTSDFPNGINFDLNFISEKNIEDVKLVILVGTSKTSQYSYMDLDKLGNKIVAEYFFLSLIHI